MLKQTRSDTSIQTRVNLLLQTDQLKDYDPLWLRKFAELAQVRTLGSR